MAAGRQYPKLLFQMNAVIYYVIKLGMITPFAQALHLEGYWFNYICRKLTNTYMDKLKGEKIRCSSNRHLIKDIDFIDIITAT